MFYCSSVHCSTMEREKNLNYSNANRTETIQALEEKKTQQ